MSNEYVVWQVDFRGGPLAVARWNGSGYDYLGDLPDIARPQEPSLYGSYLVYASDDGGSILMRNLQQGTDDGPVLSLVEDLDRTMEWPAVWVDENTGEYVVLFQSAASPADLQGSHGVIPEPCSLVLLSLGGLMLRRRRRVR